MSEISDRNKFSKKKRKDFCYVLFLSRVLKFGYSCNDGTTYFAMPKLIYLNFYV